VSTAIIAIVVVVVVAAVTVVIISIVANRRGGGEDGGERGPAAPTRPRPVILDFHVRGEEAQVYFSVPLQASGADPVLRDLLVHEAVEVFRERRAGGLPVSGVRQVVAYGRRGEEPVEVGRIELPPDGELPEIAPPAELVPHASVQGFDPLAHVSEKEFEVMPGVAETTDGSQLKPIGEELRLSEAIDARLRAQGVDPEDMSLHDLTLGLLASSGYVTTVNRAGFRTPEGPKGDIFVASKAGKDTLVGVLPHRPGEYPELSENIINQFVVFVAEQRPDRAILVTDKFGPYLIYDKERRNPNCRFVTRERLQSLVDSFALGTAG
jgi:hypothetical protein